METTPAARIILGLAFAFVLTVLASNPRVRAIEQRLGLTVLVTSGLPFLLLGVFFAFPGVDILSPKVLTDLRPLFEFGLGWMGFVIGTQLDIRRIERLPEALSTLLAIQVLIPAVLTVGVCLPTLRLLGITSGDGLVRDLLLLAGCAATAAPVAARLLTPANGRASAELLEEVVALDAVAALAALGAVSIWLRPEETATNWSLPPLALLVLLLGLGALLGVLAHAILRSASGDGEETALLLGTVALSAGFAEYLALSGPVVCAIAGAVLTNLPLASRSAFMGMLRGIERPLYLAFLVIVGASWRPDAWQAWVLAAAYVVARIGGKWLAVRVAGLFVPGLPTPMTLARVLVPQGPAAILVMAAAATLHGPAAPAPVRWAIHAVIVGAIVSELVAQVARGRMDPSVAT